MRSHYFLFLSLLVLMSCKKKDRAYTYDNIDFKEEMRHFVQEISQYSKNIQPDFNIITQNGVELITSNGHPDGTLCSDYVQAIDGQAQEGLFYGYETDNIATPLQTTTYLKTFLNKAKNDHKQILITDYCDTPDAIRNSRDSIDRNGYIGFTAVQRELDVVPLLPVSHENNRNISNLAEAQNFLYLLNLENFPDKNSFIQAIVATNYDVLITDLFYDNQAFTTQDLQALRHKANGGRRLVIAYVSIGEAEDYRYYWQSQWNNDQPIWLDEENPDWSGNYKVRYWEKDWQKIIYGNNNSYLKKVLNAGFDGAYLDIIDAFEYFEDKTAE